ncbi:hypothetical protein JCM9279_003837 [Rhodotorula babjevae]
MAATPTSPSTKRTSPAPLDTPAARPLKLPRLVPTATPSALLPTLTREPQMRTPKLAALFKKPHERDPAPMRHQEASFVDTHFDVEDAAAYQDALLILEGIQNRLNHLTTHQVRLLISLALFPQLFKPPTQHSANNFASRSAGSSSTSSRTALLATSDDPLAPTHRRLRELACALLADALDAHGGAELVGEAIAGYGMPSRDDVAPSSSPAALDDSRDTPARKKLKAAPSKGKGKARALGAGLLAAAAADDDAHDGDDALSLAANRILSDAADLWDVLGGTTARRERVRSARRPVLEVGGWDLVAVLVAAWENEAERKAAAARAQGVDSPEPLSLLRQFKPSASTSAARQLSPKALDVVFWPFVHGSTSEDGEEDEEDDEGSASEGGSAAGRRKTKAERDRAAKERAEEDGTSLEVKRQVGVRLLKLIGDAAVQGYLDGEPTVSDLVQRMKALAQDDFVALVELLADVPTAHVFTTRLFAAYLETHAHPPATVAQYRPSFTANAPSSQPISPRKLSATTSLSKLNPSSSASSSSAAHPAPAHSAYWRIPTLAHPARLVDLALRVPRDVPLGAAAAGAAASAGKLKDKARAGLSRRAQLEASRFEIVKEAVVELVVQRARREAEEGERRDGREEEEEEVLRRVRAAVERVEDLVRAAGGTDE